jgi:hypothetical protein
VRQYTRIVDSLNDVLELGLEACKRNDLKPSLRSLYRKRD